MDVNRPELLNQVSEKLHRLQSEITFKFEWHHSRFYFVRGRTADLISAIFAAWIEDATPVYKPEEGWEARATPEVVVAICRRLAPLVQELANERQAKGFPVISELNDVLQPYRQQD